LIFLQNPLYLLKVTKHNACVWLEFPKTEECEHLPLNESFLKVNN